MVYIPLYPTLYFNSQDNKTYYILYIYSDIIFKVYYTLIKPSTIKYTFINLK